MKKQNNYIIVAILSIVLLFNACKPQQKPIFDDPVSERIAKTMSALQEKLLSSPNGWIGEYYPGEKLEYGGYVLSFKFTKEGDAFIASEVLDDITKPERSQYLVDNDAGVTLKFVTYNKALHYFADPDKNVGGGLSKGFMGDYEFKLMEETHPDTIFLKGKNRGKIMKLFRPQEPATNYLKAATDTHSKAFDMDYIREHGKDSYAGTLGGKDIVLYFNGYNTFYYLDELENEITVPFIATDKGIRFHNPLNGIKELTFNETDKTLVGDGSSLALREDPNYVYYTEFLGDYTMTMNGGKQTYEVKFEKDATYRYKVTCTNWNYHIYANFDPKSKTFFINAQEIEDHPNAILSVWAAPTSMHLSGNESFGMYAVPTKAEDGSTYYKMVDNGAWSNFKAQSFVLYDFTKRGIVGLTPNRIVQPTFKKKQV